LQFCKENKQKGAEKGGEDLLGIYHVFSIKIYSMALAIRNPKTPKLDKIRPKINDLLASNIAHTIRLYKSTKCCV
jgi:hypothetical protein